MQAGEELGLKLETALPLPLLTRARHSWSTRLCMTTGSAWVAGEAEALPEPVEQTVN